MTGIYFYSSVKEKSPCRLIVIITFSNYLTPESTSDFECSARRANKIPRTVLIVRFAVFCAARPAIFSRREKIGTEIHNSRYARFFIPQRNVPKSDLDVESGHLGVRLNKGFPTRHIGTHQNIEYLVCHLSIVYGHLFENSIGWVHRGFPQLFGVHFS